MIVESVWKTLIMTLNKLINSFNKQIDINQSKRTRREQEKVILFEKANKGDIKNYSWQSIFEDYKYKIIKKPYLFVTRKNIEQNLIRTVKILKTKIGICIMSPCKHIFHRSCIAIWFESGKSSCPICRKKIFDSQEDRNEEELHSFFTSDPLFNLMAGIAHQRDREEREYFENHMNLIFEVTEAMFDTETIILRIRQTLHISESSNNSSNETED